MFDHNEEFTYEELEKVLWDLVDQGKISMTWEDGHFGYFMTPEQKKNFREWEQENGDVGGY
jgi:hypothetical protein